MLENTETIEGILISLHRSGWSIGSTAFVTIGVGLMWVVSGHNGENLFRTEGDSRSAANRVRRHRSRFSRHRTRSNPGGCLGVVTRSILGSIDIGRADRSAQNDARAERTCAGITKAGRSC
jgi:hypothetical protein